MTPVIQQRVRFRTSPRALFDLHLDSHRHSLSTGAPATISRKAGEKFKAFEGQLEGKNRLIVPGRQIAQLWRANHWKKTDCSILTLTFSAVAGGAPVDLVHVAVPACHHKGVSKGWPQYHWRPWKNTSANPPRSSSDPPADKSHLSGHTFTLGEKLEFCHSERSLRSEELCAIARLLCDDSLLGLLPSPRQQTAQSPTCPR